MKALGGWNSTGPGTGKWVSETDVDAILGLWSALTCEGV